MNVDIIQLAQVLAIIVAFVASITVIAHVSKFITRKAGATKRPEISDDRLRHIEQAVDAIAVEVERISEAQRFNSKLLAERPARAEQSLER